MRKVIDNSKGPPGGYWVWVHQETGHKIRHSNYAGISNAVKSFLKSNNFPITSQFEEELEENICANGALNLCEDFIPPSAFEKLSSFAQAIYRTAKQWRAPMTTPDELKIRRSHCEGDETLPRCNFYKGSTSLVKVMCGKCGCSGLKIALAAEKCPISKW